MPIGTQITNNSMIFFDLQDGVETNEVFHNVGEEFIEIILSNKDLLDDDELVVSPNPAVNTVKIELPSEYQDISYVVYDNKGRVINAANAPSNVFYINRDFIESGMYFLEIRSSAKRIGMKKIVFLD